MPQSKREKRREEEHKGADLAVIEVISGYDQGVVNIVWITIQYQGTCGKVKGGKNGTEQVSSTNKMAEPALWKSMSD